MGVIQRMMNEIQGQHPPHGNRDCVVSASGDIISTHKEARFSATTHSEGGNAMAMINPKITSFMYPGYIMATYV